MTHRTIDAAQATCPDAGVLAAYLDRRLDAAARRAVDAHVADCPDCREIVVDSADLIEELVERPRVVAAAPAPPHAPRWWTRQGPLVALAASLALATWAGWTWYARTTVDVAGLQAQLVEVSRERPFAARLTGFPYAPVAPVFRSAQSEPIDAGVRVAVATIEDAVAHARAADARALLAAALAVGRRPGEALAAIDDALASQPENAAWHADRAALLLALAEQGDDPRLMQALAAADRAVAIDARLPGALFNRALVLDQIAGQSTPATPVTGAASTGGGPASATQAYSDAGAAWTRYLETDATSPWADEARARLASLRERARLR